MADDEVITNVDEDPPQLLWIAPLIFSPGAGTTVSPGFLVDAIVTVPTASKWRAQFFYGPTLIREYRGTPVAGMGIAFNVPRDLIRPGADFYFRLDYLKRVAFWDTWSDWAYSGDLKMAGGVKPLPPVVIAPQDGSKHPIGNVEIRGTCSLGATAVDVLNWDNSKLADATVNGTIWTYNRVWDAGTKHVKARQWVNGTPSDPGNQHEFVVGAFAKPPKPLILSPEQGDKYPVGPLMVIGSCLSGATVEVLNWDNSKLGDATVTGTIWTYNRVWDAGTKHVKARQTVRGVASDPSAQCEFFIVEMTQPPVPVIDEPQQGSIHPVGNVRIRGTCLKGAIVDVLSWDDSVLAVATVNGTIWTLDYIWQTGFKHVKARQTLNHWRSDPSPEREFIVGVPGKPPAPEITEPAPGSKHPVGNVKIKGTCLARSTVEVLSWDGTKLADAVVDGTTWELDYTWDTGVKHVKARQTEYGKVSDPSREVEFIVGTPAIPPAPNITEPQPGSTHPTGRLTIEGTCLARATVEVLYPNDSKLGDAVIHGTNWFFDSTWDAGVKGIKARQTEYGRVSKPSITCSFKVKPSKPTITPPPNPAAAKQVLTITGVYSGTVTLQMFNEGGTQINGTFSLTGATRTFTPTADWAPGTHKVKVVQTVGGVASDPSDLRTLAVKPPVPAITGPTAPTNNRPTFSGTGHEGATVNVVQQGHATPILATATVRNGRWEATLTSGRPALPAGPYELSALQIVGGVSSAWLNPAFIIKVQPSKPAIIQPPNPAAAKQVLTITGVDSGTVALQMLNEASTQINGTFSPTGATRTFTPTADWAPGTHKVKVVQTVGGVASDPSDLCTIAVKPPVPVITGPTAPTNKRPTFSGTGHEGATVNVVQQGHATPILATATVRNGRWEATLSPDRPALPAGPYELSALQIVGGVSSAWLNPAFVIKVQPSKPAITPPPSPAAAKQVLTITGVTSGTVTLKMFTDAGAEVLGSFTGSGTTRTFTPTQNWVPGDNTVTVVQTVNGVPSDASDLLTFKAKPSVPNITYPEHEGKTSGQLPRLEGEGYSGSRLEVRYLDDTPVAEDVPVDDGSWSHPANHPWDLGRHTLKVRQTFNGQVSDWSKPHAFDVNPDIPSFTDPKEGDETSPLPTIGGKSLPYADVTVRLKGGRVLFTKTADADGEWSDKVAQPLDSGSQLIEAQQAFNGHVSDWSEVHTFDVKKEAVHPPPGIIAPREGGSMGANSILFRGTGLNDLQVKLKVTKGVVDTGADEVSVKNRQWSSHKRIKLEAGSYTWQVQHHSDSGASDWTLPRIIDITAAAFEFAEAGPVIGRPVVDSGESVLLRVQAVSTETGDGIEGLAVDWSVDGRAVMATTVTGPGGWTSFRYIPDTAGEHLVIADLTEENEGVVVAQPFEVTALQRDAWAREFTLWLNGEQVDLAQRDLVLLHGKTHKLELKVNSGSPLIGLTTIALEDLLGTVELGLEFFPLLGPPQSVVEGTFLWSISSNTGKTGFFGLKLTSPKLPDWHLSGRLASNMLADEVEAIEVDGQDIYRSAAGMVLRPGVKRQLKLILRSNSALVDLDFTVQMGGRSDVTYDPSEMVARPMLSDGLEWSAEAKKIQSNLHHFACTSVPTVRPVLLTVRQVGATLDTTIPIMNGTTPVGESIPQGIAVFNRGSSHILKVSVPNSLTPVANLHIVLEHADGPDNLVSYSCPLGEPRYVGINDWDNDLKWTVTAANEAGSFRLKISCPELEMSSYINCEVR